MSDGPMVEGKGGEKLKYRVRFQMVAWWKARGGKFKQRLRFYMVAWWMAKGGKFK